MRPISDTRPPDTRSGVARAGRFGWALVLVGALVALATITRLAIVAWQRPAADAPHVAAALAVGLVYDVAVALWLAAPLALYLALVPSARWPRAGQRRLRRAWLASALFGAVFVAVAEVIFFDEFDGRFNFVAVDYLVYPTEVTSNIWQSYPVIPALAAVALVTLLLMRALRGTLRRIDDAGAPSAWARLGLVTGWAFALALTAATVTPRLARVSADRELAELATSGYYTFAQALLGRDAPYAGLYATRPDDVLLPRLTRMVAAPTDVPVAGDGPTTRLIAGSPAPRRLNVVVVLEESLGSAYIGALHPRDPRDFRPGDSGSYTPEFDALAREGTLLTHAYSTGNRTIRALEATTASIPPLPGVSIVRRPASVGLFTLPALLRERGYATEFIYGGHAMFDGMGAYMRNNGVERVVDQAAFPDTAFTTAWGVSDEAIFDRALVELDSLHATGRPFHVTVLTVSNHKPYSYPAGRIAQDPAAHRRTHAVRYADWALGRFMREARTHAFYDGTLFVLMGDHGARVYGAAEIPLASYEVPVLFIAPGAVPAGRRVATLASSLDVPPSILGVLGFGYTSRFFGRDVLHAAPEGGRALMTHNASLALMRDGRLVVLGPRQRTSVYAVDAAGHTTPVATPSARDRDLVAEAIAWFQGADELYRRGAYGLHDRVPGATRHASLGD